MKILIWHGMDSALVYDTFTGADGTNLTSRSPDIGPTPTASDWTFQIQGNKAQCTAVGADPFGVVKYETNRANVAITATVNISVAGSRHGIAARVSNPSNFWRITIRTAGIFEIMEVNGGTQTVRASAALTINTGVDYALRCVTSGATISGSVDGGNDISYASATHNQTVTAHGLDSGNANEASIDNLRITT